MRGAGPNEERSPGKVVVTNHCTLAWHLRSRPRGIALASLRRRLFTVMDVISRFRDLILENPYGALPHDTREWG